MNTLDQDLLASLGLAGREPPASEKKDRLGQQDFLKLMVTQLQNQDPFQPMESGEFLGQIAQFGTVAGIEDLQKSFEDVARSLYSGQTLQAASLVGRDVLVPANMAVIDPANGQRGAAELPASASDVVVTVHDQTGAVVRRMPLGPNTSGLAAFQWDGFTDSGQLAPHGIYEFRAQAQVQGGRSEAVNVLLSSRVDSVALGNQKGSLTLQVDGLGEIEFSKVRRIG